MQKLKTLASYTAVISSSFLILATSLAPVTSVSATANDIQDVTLDDCPENYIKSGEVCKEYTIIEDWATGLISNSNSSYFFDDNDNLYQIVNAVNSGDDKMLKLTPAGGTPTVIDLENNHEYRKARIDSNAANTPLLVEDQIYQYIGNGQYINLAVYYILDLDGSRTEYLSMDPYPNEDPAISFSHSSIDKFMFKSTGEVYGFQGGFSTEGKIFTIANGDYQVFMDINAVDDSFIPVDMYLDSNDQMYIYTREYAGVDQGGIDTFTFSFKRVVNSTTLESIPGTEYTSRAFASGGAFGADGANYADYAGFSIEHSTFSRRDTLVGGSSTFSLQSLNNNYLHVKDYNNNDAITAVNVFASDENSTAFAAVEFFGSTNPDYYTHSLVSVSEDGQAKVMTNLFPYNAFIVHEGDIYYKNPYDMTKMNKIHFTGNTIGDVAGWTDWSNDGRKSSLSPVLESNGNGRVVEGVVNLSNDAFQIRIYDETTSSWTDWKTAGYTQAGVNASVAFIDSDRVMVSRTYNGKAATRIYTVSTDSWDSWVVDGVNKGGIAPVVKNIGNNKVMQVIVDNATNKVVSRIFDGNTNVWSSWVVASQDAVNSRPDIAQVNDNQVMLAYKLDNTNAFVQKYDVNAGTWSGKISIGKAVSAPEIENIGDGKVAISVVSNVNSSVMTKFYNAATDSFVTKWINEATNVTPAIAYLGNGQVMLSVVRSSDNVIINKLYDLNADTVASAKYSGKTIVSPAMTSVVDGKIMQAATFEAGAVKSKFYTN